MHFASQVTDQVTYDLPAGATVEGAPADASRLEGHAVYIAKTKSDAGEVTVARVLARAFDVAKPSDYQDLRGFYQRWPPPIRASLSSTSHQIRKGFKPPQAPVHD